MDDLRKKVNGFIAITSVVLVVLTILTTYIQLALISSFDPAYRLNIYASLIGQVSYLFFYTIISVIVYGKLWLIMFCELSKKLDRLAEK